MENKLSIFNHIACISKKDACNNYLLEVKKYLFIGKTFDKFDLILDFKYKNINKKIKSYLLCKEINELWYVTMVYGNKRIGFKSERKNISIALDKIDSLNVRDGILHIAKTGREAPYMFALSHYQWLSAILMKLV